MLFHGYYFRGLATGQTVETRRRRALIAYPAEYRSSGVMTFLVTGNNDVVYEKDLGPNTTPAARAMTGIHKDGAWRASNELGSWLKAVALASYCQNMAR